MEVKSNMQKLMLPSQDQYDCLREQGMVDDQIGGDLAHGSTQPCT